MSAVPINRCTSVTSDIYSQSPALSPRSWFLTPLLGTHATKKSFLYLCCNAQCDSLAQQPDKGLGHMPEFVAVAMHAVETVTVQRQLNDG